MGFSLRRRKPPAPATLERGERVLAFGTASEDAYVVATDQALHLPGGTRLPWYRFDHVRWREGHLSIQDTDGEKYAVPLVHEGRLPEVVRERVTSSIVVNRHVRLDERGGVRLVARRVPGAAEFTWTQVFDAGLDPEDPEVRELAAEALRLIRLRLGA
ncbi:hypothetical protein [Rhizohabitans arisaemae]|uniref:hypothetical protein n=1 Tax=Rhizohabitans arisaemae TaxID=2720610 RepID=UPI0024B18BE5|nr:hypothetical protein [Rhizohabitans arisaemae]